MADTPPLDSELGSALSWYDSLFLDYLDPSVGSVAWYEARDYANMLKTDGQARKLEQVLTLPAMSAQVAIEPAKGDSGQAEWVTEVLTRPANNGGMSTPLRLVVAQMCSAFTFRVASFEKVFTRSGGRVVYDKLAFRPATITRVLRDRKTGGYRGLEQDPAVGSTDPIRIPARRAFTYVHGQHREPVIGLSEMEVALTCWRTKQKLRFLWFLFLEGKALPKVTTYADTTGGSPVGSSDGAKAAAKTLARLRGGGTAAMPMGIRAEVLESGGQAADYYQAALDYLDSEMTGSVLAQFTDLASKAASGTGSLALSRDGSDLFKQSREAVLRDMEDQFTSYVIADLVAYNDGPKAPVPRLKLGPIAKPDLETLLSALGRFGKAAVPPEFMAYLVEAAAEVLDMHPDKVAGIAKAAREKAEQAAKTEQQAAVAQVAGPVAGIHKAVTDKQRKDSGGSTAGSSAA